MMKELIEKNRSFRRFYREETLTMDALKSFVNLARLSASAGNLQPLKYILSATPERNELIFSCLSWAVYLKDWKGPKLEERAAAYIIILGDLRISKNFGCDHGIAAQSILLGAREEGYGGCIVASINRENLRKSLNISEKYEILLVIAIGKPREEVVIEEVSADGNIKYWRDDKAVHHVPKRRLEEIIVDN
ncbi:MAG: nitroreductase family protein [Elusimicrobiota bacterium]